MNDQITIGVRLKALRRWRGMTLEQLAGQAGLSASFLSRAERGERALDRRSHIAALAAALKVSESDLVGGPHLSEDPIQSGPHVHIPALREALQTNKLTDPAVDRARPLPKLAKEVTDRIVSLRGDDDLVEAGRLLPDVLDELHWHIAQPSDEASRQEALEILIEACMAAGLTAKDLGYVDLAHVAMLRAEDAAALLDDPVQQGKVECLRIWTFPRERSWDRRLTAAERAADILQPHVRTPLGMHVLGMLTLHAALSAAVVQRPDVVSHWLTEANQLADRVADDIKGNWQSFSKTNVRLWHVAIEVERGKGGGAVLDLANTVDQAKITYRERKAGFMADVGRGLAREPKTRGEAVRWLRDAERAGPQYIRNHPATRETVAVMLEQAKAAAISRELRGMAARMGIPH